MGDPKRLQAIAAKVGELPVLPQVAFKVLELVADPDIHMGKLESVISRDQALTAKILRLANSAFFGLRGEVQSLSRAIVLMGLDQLRSLVIATSTESLFRAKQSRFKDRILWEHALGVGLTARVLAHETRSAGVEEAFTAGLLHDIGKSVLDQNLGDKYQQVIERVYNEHDTFINAERELLGLDHQEIAAVMIEKWALGPALQEAVGLHHAPLEATVNPKLCATVSLANAMCVKMGIGPERVPNLDLMALGVAEILKIDQPRLDAIMAMVIARLAEEKALFGLA